MRNFLAKGREIHVGKIETKQIMGRKQKKRCHISYANTCVVEFRILIYAFYFETKFWKTIIISYILKSQYIKICICVAKV